MVEAQSVATLITVAVLALLGGIGTLVVVVGTATGALEWTAGAWLVPIGLVAGTCLLANGAVDLLGDLWAAASTGDITDLVEDVDSRRRWTLLD